MRAILIFLDGIGLGKNDFNTNPFVYTDTPNLLKALGNMPLCPEAVGLHGNHIRLLSLDANLGIPGIPQSATGQTSLFTGINAAKIAGKHLNRYPDEQLSELLRTDGIFVQLINAGLSPAFINAYRPEYFSEINKGLKRIHSCSTMLTYHAGLPFRTLEQLKSGQAVYMDITNEYLEKMGYPVGIIEPEKAGERLVQISRNYDFILFEYFLSDVVGHLADPAPAGIIVGTLDRFIGSVLKNINKDDTLLIITSDHGNLEETNHKNHTCNPVPALISVPSGRSYHELKDITGVAGLIREFLGLKQ